MTMTEPLAMFMITTVASALLILAGVGLRRFIPALGKMHMPAAVTGGILGMLLGPQVLGLLYVDTDFGHHVKDIYKASKELPAFFISVVFAALMVGKPLPSIRKIWKEASPHLVVGYTTAWGQYVVGCLVAIMVLVPFLDANALSAALIPIGFQGGYGTAAGLANTYGKLDFAEGYDLAIGMATAGKIAAILVGLLLVNLAVKRKKMISPEDAKKEDTRGAVPDHQARKDFKQKREEQYFSADTLIIHFAILCLAIAIGFALREALALLESAFVADPAEGIVQYIPLFPMALIGGFFVQYTIELCGWQKHLNEHHIHSISHSFLDMLIVVAIATISLKVLAEYWQVLAILFGAGLAWNLAIFFFLAPLVYRNKPWERGVSDFAHATGAATTAMMLVKVIDPTDKSGARGGFTLKQPFYETIVGGGLLTALSLPIMATIGLWPTMIFFSILTVATLVFGFTYLRIRRNNPL